MDIHALQWTRWKIWQKIWHTERFGIFRNSLYWPNYSNLSDQRRIRSQYLQMLMFAVFNSIPLEIEIILLNSHASLTQTKKAMWKKIRQVAERIAIWKAIFSTANSIIARWMAGDCQLYERFCLWNDSSHFESHLRKRT